MTPKKNKIKNILCIEKHLTQLSTQFHHSIIFQGKMQEKSVFFNNYFLDSVRVMLGGNSAVNCVYLTDSGKNLYQLMGTHHYV